MAEYTNLRGTLQDYLGLVTQYGYTVLFVAAFPIGPTFAFASAYIQIRIDGWKLCQAHRRPIPRTTEDIGVWQDMLEILSALAVLFNMALIAFTGQYLINYTYSVSFLQLISIVSFY